MEKKHVKKALILNGNQKSEKRNTEKTQKKEKKVTIMISP
jgi:hypothetical protein